MNWRSIKDGLIFTVLVLSIVCLVTSVATMVLVIAKVQSKEKEEVNSEVKYSVIILVQPHEIELWFHS